MLDVLDTMKIFYDKLDIIRGIGMEQQCCYMHCSYLIISPPRVQPPTHRKTDTH